MKKYAFLDRDGTLIFEPQDTYQVDSITQLRILSGVIDGLKFLTEQGYVLVMITNQDGLGSTSYLLSSFEEVQNTLLETLRENGIVFQKILICPHLPAQECDCRKPKLGLVKTLNDIDTKTSFVCGDRKSDKQLACNMGITYLPMKTNGNFMEALQATSAGIYV